MKVISSPVQTRHDPQQIMLRGRMIKPVEQPERLRILAQSLAEDGHEAIEPGAHALDPVRRVHDPLYVDFLSEAYAEWQKLSDASVEVLPNTHHYRRASQAGQPPGRVPQSITGKAGWYVSDLNCAIGEGTWEAIEASARSAIHAAQLVTAGERSAFAACRPPGHHAYRDQAAGFCYINNAAVVADMLASSFGRVAVIDFDTHHGDGTQSIFYGRDDVFVGNVHTDPVNYYPFFIGYADERGSGKGEGYNLNLPLQPGAGDSKFVAACTLLSEAAARAGCQALVLSAGWDAHRDDPLSLLRVSGDAYHRIGEIFGAMRLPTVIVQEGGYSLDVIAKAPRRFVAGFSARH
ncbi:histone deacetylase family protein [Tardiphaga alba]|uniref:Histone deacetylase family protein n=1 Tax=Tardiphaga alba TaxID=340268 RepID=A0ABX8A522_9BRAD|nr:histone deacetylase family protein [Tardiphaga alba]QUS38652.1 histone deacetylase family protein [Tardiphaga alba]